MSIKETILKDCFIIDPKVFKDKRGYFLESFNQESFQKATGLQIDFVQDNESFSTKGVLRGLHFQKGKYSQAKLIRVISGEILDVVVDIRPDSPTFLQHFSIKLSSNNKKQLFVPKHFAHGFLVLSETAIINYKCDEYYHKESESGIIYNDRHLNIDWLLESKDFILSEKDQKLPSCRELFSIKG
ncbi:dTDP-4-dehydrorhamnose 3,5-epimerase [Pseudofulvibacter geojedonensis]|uniref:dTDP-4-dehydrorhamnose 3,5-epimerase n=1 Tax=Pseudofulvibacter geojedonensis TaxID=1123758 RepID=A0ABW3I408_9FLAO